MATAATDPADLGVLEAAAALGARTVSAVELLAAAQARIAARNGGEPSFEGAAEAVNAWVRLYPELAAEQAEAADARRAREGADAPLLCGLPFGLKDLFAVAGLPLTASSRVLAGDPPAAADSAVYARLRDRGMVLVGHTHTHEFAAGGTTDQVGNPWAVDRSAGGSSGGSAAALAAGMVPASVGTDTAGSVRIPAALSGVSSIKPTRGRLPIDGIIPLGASLDHPGPMARTVADAAVLLAAMADAPDPAPMAPRPGPRPLGGLRIAVTDRPAAFAVEDDVLDGFAAAREACIALGAEVVDLPPGPAAGPGDEAGILFHDVWEHHRALADRADRYRESIRSFVDRGRRYHDAAAYAAAQERRGAVTAEWADWFAAHRVDALLEPTVISTAPLRGPGYDPEALGGEGDPLILLTALWNFTGFPAVALPAGLGRRTVLPVGVSLIGPPDTETGLVAAAVDLQAGPLPPPGIAPA
jgi:aspartyl-tRNA(Asn)/glutamyl-tRNA(Gln) amidotransferase subunit A